MDIGSVILLQRRKLGMNQAELAKKTGLSRQAISHYEAGKGQKISTACKILDALGLKVWIQDLEMKEGRTVISLAQLVDGSADSMTVEQLQRLYDIAVADGDALAMKLIAKELEGRK
ncbi:Uncharacterised protein [Acetobacterium wieringae]|uniref:helix-turn-helix transcriptional regulator n=1 Tax=Acetobacterium wieringae TaxID=52694 RepID=UPI001DC5D4C8|nr:helix-turn-helix domain-containing protein [Acetobacterium wieringae]VUZ28496.1 Uncharacterised protein [Acetobacterium wieringae]